MNWAYAVTTYTGRSTTLLARTNESLLSGGFIDPILFIDGCNSKDDQDDYLGFNNQKVFRSGTVGCYGNWILTLWELYIRNPKAERFIIFQDDIVSVKNLRQYLEAVPVPDQFRAGKAYLNLYTAQCNERFIEVERADGNTGKMISKKGWFNSDCLGRGALALMFHESAMPNLMSGFNMAHRIRDYSQGHRSIDGAVMQCHKNQKLTRFEYCHNPSLINHTGLRSTIGNAANVTAPTFPGEDVDAMTFLRDTARPVRTIKT